MSRTMWKQLIQEATSECEFKLPTTLSDVEAIEKLLQQQLPRDLRDLLEETNGVYWRPGYVNIIWPVEEIGQHNHEMRTNPKNKENYMTFDSLLFFSNLGVDGVQFAFPVAASGVVLNRNIIQWEPISDSRCVIVYSLKDFLIGWLKGSLKF